jgi:bacterioferritin-associated ferredoxin
MIVCHCHAITDRAIREAARAGATTAAAVGAACGASTACGGCHDLVDSIVRAERLAAGEARVLHETASG